MFRAIAVLVLAGCATPLAAQSIATVEHPIAGHVVTLFNDQGNCPEGGKRTTFLVGKHPQIQPELRGTTVEGCWALHEKVVYALYDDGDRLRLPQEAFTWAPGYKPAAMTL
jgi:hypothetical protein